MDEQPKGTILSGCRVLDLTAGRGMFCARLLADMGAEVIRIESPQGAYDESDPSFLFLTVGKRRVTLDIDNARGKDIFLRMVAKSDILIEDSSPGYLASIGFDYARLSQVNEGLIMASVTGFGQEGPYRDYHASDLTISALGGQMYVSGQSGTQPLKLPGNQTDYLASLFAANGIMLALLSRHATGRGQSIDISALECTAAALDHVLVRYFCEETVATRQGSLYWNNAFSIFPCCDGYVLLSLMQQWETLVKLLEAEDMAEDLTEPKWQNRRARVANIGHIRDVVTKWAQTHHVAELVETGRLMRFPWAEVASISELLTSPQLTDRDFWGVLKPPGESGKYKIPRVPCKFSESPWQTGEQVEPRGGYNAEYFRWITGLSPEEIDALSCEGVI